MMTFFLFMPTVRVVSNNLVIIITIVSKLINGLLHIAKINLKILMMFMPTTILMMLEPL